MCVFFRGTLRDTGLLLSSLASFVASTRLIWSGIGAIDSLDQSRQGFEQYDTSEVAEKIFFGKFSMACREKMFTFGIFKVCVSNFAYASLENIKNQHFFHDKSSKSRPRKIFRDFGCIILFKTLTGLIKAINRTNS